ncbi:MFS transporter [Mycolicibacterium sp.]|uniref:MFS transporter n=1 Tax=Mycolicibacterium sp. TaxID=2320850 RepID=UPI003D106C67
MPFPGKQGVSAFGQGTDRGIYSYVCVFGAFLYSGLLIAPLLASRLTAQFNLSATQTGLLFSLEYAAFSLAAIPALLWTTRLNLHNVSYVCAAIVVGGNIVSGLIDSFPILVVVRMIVAAAAGSITVIILAIGGKTSNPGRSFGLFVVAQLAMGAVLLALIPHVLPPSGVRPVYWLLAVLISSGFAVIRNIDPWLLRPERVVAARPTAVRRTIPLRFVLGAVAIMTFYLGLSGVWTFIGEIGHSAGTASDSVNTVLAIATVAGILSALVAAIVGDHRYQYLFMIAGYAGFCASIVLLLGAPALLRFAIAAIAFKFAWTFILPYLFAGLSALSSSPHVMSTANVMIGIGFAVGPVLSGALIDRTGGYSAMLLVGAGAMAVSMLCVAIGLRPSHDDTTASSAVAQSNAGTHH